MFWPKETVEILQELTLPELSTVGFSKVEKIEAESFGDVGIVVLKSGCYELSANVEAIQAESIKRGLEKIFAPRPNAHDIAKEIFNSFGIELLMVKITELKDNAYYSKIILRQGNTILNLDARPSDATAIAVRTGSPIYINSTLLKEVGKKIC
ncbi:MAG: bifunctional nuclease family protein [Candidatus Aenigmatarchaeota archaeon]